MSVPMAHAHSRASSASPRRRPLHARSDSETNASNSPIHDDDDDDADAAAGAQPLKPATRLPPPPPLDLFPRLPSQFLSPDHASAATGIHIYEDATASPVFDVHEAQPVDDTPPPKPAHRRTRSAKGKQRKRPSPERRPNSWLDAPPALSLAIPAPDAVQPPPPPVSPLSLVSLRRAQLEELDAAAKREEQLRRQQLSARASTRSSASPLRSGHSSPRDPDERLHHVHDKAFLDRYQALVLNHFKDDGPVTPDQLPPATPGGDRPRSRGYLRDAARPRSRSSNHLPSSSRPPSLDEGRPGSRPASSPAARPTSQPASRPPSSHAPTTTTQTPARPVSQRSRRGAYDAQQSLLDSSEEESAGASAAMKMQVAARDTPRSVSQPPQLSTEAMIEELLGDDVQLHYPRLQKPSVASMRSDSSSLRRAYPKPLRLSRKRADSTLAQTAAADAPSSSPPGLSPRDRSVSSTSQGALTPTYGFDFEDVPDLSFSVVKPGHLSAAYSEEMGDTLGELQAPNTLRHQRSLARGSSMGSLRVPLSAQSSMQSLRNQRSCDSIDSRPGTSSSQASHLTFFYSFLNNSRMAWARDYYSSEHELDIEAPPVTDIDSSPGSGQQQQPPPPPRGRGVKTPSRQTSDASVISPSSWTTITGRSSSPSSAGYADRIFIPRLRPMIQRDTSSTALSSAGGFGTDNDEGPSSGEDDDEDDDEDDSGSTPRRRVRQAIVVPQPPPPAAPASNDASYGDSIKTPSLHDASEARRHRPRSWNAPGSFYAPQRIEMGGPAAHFHRHSAPIQASSRGPWDPLHMPETPRLRPDRHTRNTLYSWRAPSLEVESQFSPINRQFWLLLLGFVCPVAWWVGAVLPIPAPPEPQPVDADSSTQPAPHAKLEGPLADFWDSDEHRRWQKGRRWRVINRFMSVAGVAIVAVVIAVAVWSALR